MHTGIGGEQDISHQALVNLSIYIYIPDLGGLQFKFYVLICLCRYGENDKLPEYIKEKLHCLSSILVMFTNPTGPH